MIFFFLSVSNSYLSYAVDNTLYVFGYNLGEIKNTLGFDFDLGADYIEIFILGWNFSSVYRVKRNCNDMENFNLGWNIIASKKFWI